MKLSPRYWRPVHLLTAWGTYWAALVGVKLGPGIAAIARMATPGAKGSASVGFDNAEITAKVLEGTQTVWEGTATLSTIALWVTLPPLVLWGIWMLMRPSRDIDALGASDIDAPGASEMTARPALGEGAARPIEAARDTDAERGRRMTPDPARVTPRR